MVRSFLVTQCWESRFGRLLIASDHEVRCLQLIANEGAKMCLEQIIAADKTFLMSLVSLFAHLFSYFQYLASHLSLSKFPFRIFPQA